MKMGRWQRIKGSMLASMLLLVLSTCSDDSVGPELGQPGQLSFVTVFQSRAASVIDVGQVLVELRRQDDSSVATVDTVGLQSGADSVDFDVTVTVLTASDTFLLTLTLIDPVGDTVFVGGPTQVTARTSGSASDGAPPTEIVLEYVGVGAEAVSVSITTPAPLVFFGDSTLLQAVALDGLVAHEDHGIRDLVVGAQLAELLCGGGAPEGAIVSDEELCALERQAFLRLAGTPASVARIEHILREGRPLRN